MPATYSPAHRRFVLAVLGALLLVVAGYSLATGVIVTGFGEVLAALPEALRLFASASHADADRLALILAEIRIPRLLLGVLVGAGLAICGAVMQGLFRNPMADPGLLGVSSGAALGAVLSIVFGAVFLPATALIGAWLLPLMAFVGGAVSIFIVYQLSSAAGKTDIAAMLLAGIAVNAIAGAFIGLLSYLADDAATARFNLLEPRQFGGR